MNEVVLTDQLARIETKLDTILERLKWATESNAEWYASQHEQPKHDPVLPLDFKAK